MTAIRYTFQCGDNPQSAEAHIPPTSRPDFPSCGVFAFAKAGSVLVNAIVRGLMAEVGVPLIDWPELWHGRGIDMATIQCDFTQVFPQHGYCVAGFRHVPNSFLGGTALRRLRKLLVVRDPRDMLVSRYFSIRYSHKLEAQGTPQFVQVIRQVMEDAEMDLDRHCLFNSWIVNADFFLHRDIIADPQTLVLKYEDFVYDKDGLAVTIRDWFGLDVSQERLAAIIAPYQAIPATERPDQHVRQAHPGDYRRKLKPQTIAVLDGVFAEYMAAFGYQPG